MRTRATPAAATAFEALLAEGARPVVVTTVARLLARVYRRHPVPRLFVGRTPVDERHVLVVDGVPCFSRTVGFPGGGEGGDGDGDRAAELPEASAATTAAAVAESLEHLAARYAAGRVDIAGIGLDDASLEACRTLAHVGDVRHVARTDLPTTLERRLAECAASGFVRRRAAHVQPLLDGLLASLVDVPSGCASGGAAAGGPRRRAPTAIALLGAFAAVGTIGHAFATHVRLSGLAAPLESERVRLRAALAEQHALLATLHEHPLDAVASLARAEALRAGAPPDAEALLSVVAGALRGRESLRIDSIAWAMPSDDGRDAVFADASSLPVRAEDPLATLGAGLDVEVSGHVTGADGVGAAEGVVNGFAAALEAAPDIGGVTGLDSPLERAADGAAIGAPSVAGVEAGSGWRLSFRLDGRRIEP